MFLLMTSFAGSRTRAQKETDTRPQGAAEDRRKRGHLAGRGARERSVIVRLQGLAISESCAAGCSEQMPKERQSTKRQSRSTSSLGAGTRPPNTAIIPALASMRAAVA